jgi:hypothetical protein
MNRRSLKGARTQSTRTEGLFRATMPWLAEDYVRRFTHTPKFTIAMPAPSIKKNNRRNVVYFPLFV